MATTTSNTLGIPSEQIHWKIEGAYQYSPIVERFGSNPGVSAAWERRRANKQTCEVCGQAFVNLGLHVKVHNKDGDAVRSDDSKDKE